MKVVLNPKYIHLRPWIEQLPEHFEKEGKIIYNARNQIRIMRASDGSEVCVKRFHAPRFLNSYIYHYLKRSKARRSYENALFLLAHKVGTPEPIAYIEQYTWNGLAQSYLVTMPSSLTHLHREFTLAYTPELDETIAPLAQFTAHMHEEWINHLDFSPGNILWDSVNGTYQFEIIDLNRMKFGPVSLKEGCRSIRRICARRYFFDRFADEYAKARQMDATKCRYWIHYYRDRFWHKGKKANYEYD